MPRIEAKQIWLSLLVVALFAPIVLLTGWAALRPPWLAAAVSGVPLFPLAVIGLLVLFVVLVWIFASLVFGAGDEGGGQS